MFIKKSLKTLVLVVLVLALSGFTYAFAAANTIPVVPKAGEGEGAISGYDVTAVQYNLNSLTPTTIDTVTFTLSAAATTVRIKLVAAGTTWYTCTTSSGNIWSCNTTGATVISANSLQVVAAN